MGESKKYYWLKLQKDFFKRHDIRIVESMPNGKDYIIFYLKLLCESTSSEGYLRFSETIPYNADMLSIITNTNVDIVRSATKVFQELDMVELLDDGTYFMSEVSKMLGSSKLDEQSKKTNAERQKRFREKKKLIENNVTVTLHRNGEIEKELEKDIEKNKEIHNAQSNAIACEPSITITLNDKSEFPIYQSMIDEWNELYPNVDIMQELRNMKGWCNANPTKRKTKRGILRFINNWLSREQDKPKYNKQDKELPTWYAQTTDDNVHDVDDDELKRMQEALRKKANQ